MTTSQIGYAKVLQWVKHYLIDVHATTVGTVAWSILCLLAAQSLTPAALARALPMEEGGTGRNRLRRVQRWHQGPPFSSSHLTSLLVKAALALLPSRQLAVVALDTTRAGGWEIFLAGVVFAGHILPVAWAVIPYPWPRGRFRETTLALIEQLQAAFPRGIPWVLVCDRGFPSPLLFAHLLAKGSGYSIRLRLSDWIEVEGVYGQVKEHLERGRLKEGERVRGRIGKGSQEQPYTSAWVVVSTAVAKPPKHKRNPGSERERKAREKAREQHQKHKGRKSRAASAQAKKYAQTWVLFTTAPSVEVAVAWYTQRMPIEESLRDCHHGWQLREAVVGLKKEEEVGRLMGIAVLGYRLQVELGRLLSESEEGKLRRSQWTVTDRVSLFWCGKEMFEDAGHDWSLWLKEQWEHLVIPTMDAVLEEAA